MPFFSVIIPTYNRYEQTIQAVESVLYQNFKDYEIILIDDGSTDATPELEGRYRGRIRYVRQDNRGVSAARNHGIEISRSPFCAFIDSDDRWRQEKLKEHYHYIQAHPEVTIHQSEETWMRRGRRVNPGLKHLKQEGRIYLQSLKLCLISPSSVVINRELFERYGCFDEMLPACEDYDLWLRITLNEWVGLIRQELNIRYGGHADQLSARYWGMDRFRIYSLIKMITRFRDDMTGEYLRATRETALQKMNILYQGSLKRGKDVFAEKLSGMITALRNECYSSIDSSILLPQ